MARRVGTGMFPRQIIQRFPLLPSEEEGRLHDMRLRENFIERIFTHLRSNRLADPAGRRASRDPTRRGLLYAGGEPMSKIQINAPAPDFGLRDWQGQTVRLSDYKGNKHVVLVFNRGFL